MTSALSPRPAGVGRCGRPLSHRCWAAVSPGPLCPVPGLCPRAVSPLCPLPARGRMTRGLVRCGAGGGAGSLLCPCGRALGQSAEGSSH